MDTFQANMLDAKEGRAIEVAESLLAWVLDVCPDLEGGQAHPLPNPPPLPGAVVEVTGWTPVLAGDERFPRYAIQEAEVVAYEVRVLLGAGAVDGPLDAVACDSLLKACAERLRGSARYDGTLGDRVRATSPQMTADFDDVIATFENGRSVRAGVVRMVVADRETEGSWA